ncbi:MAG: PIN domain-containing protein [Methanobacteriaceae archaeon]
MKKEIIIDTNFFMIPFQFGVDIISELQKTLPGYDLVAPNFVIKELKKLKKTQKGKDKIAAGIGIKIANSPLIVKKEVELKKKEYVDNALLRISKVLATNDKELHQKAKAKGITVVYLRQKKYMAIDGHI